MVLVFELIKQLGDAGARPFKNTGVLVLPKGP
jgi:hypothetical protein